MDDSQKKEYNFPRPLHLTEPVVRGNIDDGLINAVIAAAVWSVNRKPREWGRMMAALDTAARKTEKGTVQAFLFQAMVDRLLEEFYLLYPDGDSAG